MNPQTPVRVLFFSVLREKIGWREVDIAVEGKMTPTAFLRLLFERMPVLASYEGSLRLAVNQEYADDQTTIGPGDEVAVITPTSGG